MSHKRYSCRITSTLALVLFATNVSASVFFPCPATPQVWFDDARTSIGSISFPAGSVFRTDLDLALVRWNSVRGMTFEFDPIVTSPANFRIGNGRNEIVFATNARVGGVLAVTRVRGNCLFGLIGVISEADIEFNVTSNWETGSHNPTVVETNPSFRFTAVHEMGHFLGLDHEDNVMSVVMTTASAFWGQGQNTRHHIFPDDAVGSRTLYPHENRETDLGISNFQFTGPDTTALILPSATLDIPRGGSFVTGFAFGNLGNTNINSFDAVIVLSNNNVISTSDRVIANLNGFSTPGFFDDFTFTLAVPRDLTGEFFVGGILDQNNAIAEAREGNNRVVFPQKIRIAP